MSEFPSLKLSCLCLLECPIGAPVLIDINSKDNVTVDIIGPSEDSADPTDALAGSGEKLSLCNGDAYIIKNICPNDAALILGIAFSVKDVSTVKIIFLNSSSDVITEEMVSIKKHLNTDVNFPFQLCKLEFIFTADILECSICQIINKI